MAPRLLTGHDSAAAPSEETVNRVSDADDAARAVLVNRAVPGANLGRGAGARPRGGRVPNLFELPIFTNGSSRVRVLRCFACRLGPKPKRRGEWAPVRSILAAEHMNLDRLQMWMRKSFPRSNLRRLVVRRSALRNAWGLAVLSWSRRRTFMRVRRRPRWVRRVRSC